MKFSASAFYPFFLNKLLSGMNYRFTQLLGSACAGCGASCQKPVCDACYATIALPPIRCCVCGLALVAVSVDSRCKACIAKPPAFNRLYCAGNYEGILADCIVRAKIACQPAAIAALRNIQTRKLAMLDANTYQGYTVMAMPTPKLRLFQRGFNLPSLLADALCKQWQLPRVPEGVVKLPLSTQKQALLSATQRKKNRHLYQIGDNMPEKVLVVDDIVTTGQTARYLARVLRQNGAKNVVVWALARTQLDCI